MDAKQRDGLIYILLSVTGYSFLPIWVKALQAAQLEPLDIATWRFGLAAPIFWLLIRALRSPLPEKPLPRLRLLAMGMLLALAALLAFFGLERIPAGTFVVLFYAYPAMVAVFSVLLGDRLPLPSWLALGLTLVGVVLTVPDFGAGLSGDNLIGAALALINALTVAIYMLVSSRLLKGHSSVARASAWSVTGALLVMICIAPFRSLNVPPNPNSWVNVLALAAFSTVLPVFFLNFGIQMVGPARAAILGTAEPILTLVLATLLLGERMQPVQLVGGAFILASIVLLQAQSLRRVRALKTPAVG